MAEMAGMLTRKYIPPAQIGQPYLADPVAPEAKTFHWADWLVFCIFLAASLGIGIWQAWATKKQTPDEFLNASRSMGIIPVALSMLSAFISAILVLGTPAEMYTYGTQYWLIVPAMMLAALLAAILFVPFLYPLNYTSSYEYLDERFHSKAAKVTGSIILLIMQLFYMGVCLYSPSTALEAVTGFPEWASIVIGALLSLTYVALGGMKASVITSAFQTVIMLLGIIIVIAKGLYDLDGIVNVWNINDAHDRIEFWVWDPNPLIRHSFWTLVVGGTILWLGTYGPNQAAVQRYCSVPTQRKAVAVMLWQMPGVFILVTLACISGLTIFAWYAYVGCDPLESGLVDNSNQLIAFYVMDRLDIPTIPGIFLATLFAGALSTMSSCLGACAAVTWKDLLEWKFGYLSDNAQTIVNKVLVILYGFAGMGMAFAMTNLGGTVIQMSYSFTGSASGPILGLFFLGGCFPCANWLGAVIGGIIGLAFPLWISIGSYSFEVDPGYLDSPGILNCTHLWPGENGTLTPPPPEPTMLQPEDVTGIQELYLMSYMYMVAIGASTCIVVGLFVSLVTGCSDPIDVEPRHNMPFFDRLFCCLPNKTLAIMRCKIDLWKGYDAESSEGDEEEGEKEGESDSLTGSQRSEKGSIEKAGYHNHAMAGDEEGMIAEDTLPDGSSKWPLDTQLSTDYGLTPGQMDSLDTWL